MAAVRREIKEVETQLDIAQAEFSKVNDQLRSVQQARMNAEEELVAQNTRLKQMLDELAMRKETSKRRDVEQEDAKVTVAELSRKVDEALLDVLEAKFRDEAFATAIVEQSAATTGDKVRVEFEGDEVFWTMQENYTFEMLLQDAARYWDVSPNDAVLNDERGAIWPDDAYVALEMQNAPSARIALRIKATAAEDDDLELDYDDDDDDGSIVEEDQDFMAIAEAAEDELLLAQSRGTATTLSSQQKLALRRKMRRELGYFACFVVLFIHVIYARRVVRNGFFMQQSVAAALITERFGEYGEKTFMDISTVEEAFDWMQGPLLEGVYPQEAGTEQRYVMSYNKVVGQLRFRQLRVKQDGCSLSTSVYQDGYANDGSSRQYQLIDYCYPAYDYTVRSEEAFGPEELQTAWSGFTYTTAEENGLEGLTVIGQVENYDGSGFVLDLDGADRATYISTLENRRANRWIDRQTRAVLISLNLYNGNYDYLCQSTFLIEFSQGGSLVPSFKQNVLRTDIWHGEYFAGRQLVASIPEMFLYTATIGYLLQFGLKLARIHRVTGSFVSSFRDGWNVVEALWFMLMLLAIILRLAYYLDGNRKSFDIWSEGYTELANLAFHYNLAYIIDACTVLMCAVKSIRFFALQPDLAMLQGTLAQAFKDLYVFVILLLTILAGFVIMALNIFGAQAESYKNFVNSFGTLFLILLGGFDFDEMWAVDLQWAVVFFLLYVIFMFFVVLNIFLAILNDAFAVAHTSAVWQQLERRKPSHLRDGERTATRKAMWREAKNRRYVKRFKKEKIRAAKKAAKEHAPPTADAPVKSRARGPRGRKRLEGKSSSSGV